MRKLFLFLIAFLLIHSTPPAAAENLLHASVKKENCGISGIVLFPKVRTENEIVFIRNLATELLTVTSKRGTDATGMVIFEKDKKAHIFKRPKRASDFVELSEFKKHVENITEDTTIIIGHNRAASVGSPENNNNNHPVFAGSIYLVHNGDIENHNELFKKYGFKRQGEVDTEVIAQMINYYGKDGITIDSVRKGLAELKGSMAIAFADERDPYRLYLVRSTNPMTYIYDAKRGLLIFDSEMEYIFRAWGNLEQPYPVQEKVELSPNSGVVIDVKKGTVEKFVPFSTIDTSATPTTGPAK